MALAADVSHERRVAGGLTASLSSTPPYDYNSAPSTSLRRRTLGIGRIRDVSKSKSRIMDAI